MISLLVRVLSHRSSALTCACGLRLRILNMIGKDSVNSQVQNTPFFLCASIYPSLSLSLHHGCRMSITGVVQPFMTCGYGEASAGGLHTETTCEPSSSAAYEVYSLKICPIIP